LTVDTVSVKHLNSWYYCWWRTAFANFTDFHADPASIIFVYMSQYK
jgi:hypothetical protein